MRQKVMSEMLRQALQERREELEAAGFDPDAELQKVREFRGGLRTVQGYAEMANRVRDLDNWITAGGRPPADWQQIVTSPEAGQ